MTEENLNEMGYEDVVVFTDPDYDGCIVGVSTDSRAVYSYGKMVK